MVRIISVANLKGGVGKHHPGLNLAAIIPWRPHTRRRVHQTIMDQLGLFPDKVSPAVRENAVLTEAPGHGKPVILFASGSNGAEDYRQVASWLSARFV